MADRTDSTAPRVRSLIPVLPVYGWPYDPAHDDAVSDLIDAATGPVVAICPGGHVAQRFEPGEDGAVHTDHQPCPGAWWFAEEFDA